ncbi:MAG: TetR/AcrR family transcriptional regulator [Acidimicrobiia bacterium]|nr:TetR/AcrR family transcriptional regulator [Acidimicrobiia bacterium]
MTQPAGRGSSATRRRILEAAHRLLSDPAAPVPSMQAIAEAADVSRQALYLHFRDRAGLLLATVDHIDDSGDLAEGVSFVRDAPDALAAMDRFVGLVAWTSPRIADVARTLDAARASDPDLEAAWQDRMAGRRRMCRELVGRLIDEGRLRPEWDPDAATDLLWEITSVRTWEDLVVDREWSPEAYMTAVQRVLRHGLTTV